MKFRAFVWAKFSLASSGAIQNSRLRKVLTVRILNVKNDKKDLK